MIVYHGGTEIVKTPRILSRSVGRDFGVGFYTTSIREQAKKWARRQAVNRRVKTAVLNVYEYENDYAVEHLAIKTFEGYSFDWIDMVVSCRRDSSYRHGFDIVIGKIANDDVGETVQAIVDGLSSKEFALSRLVYMTANDQICFCSVNALTSLKFIASERAM